MVERAAHGRHPDDLINVPAFAIVTVITWLLVLGIKEIARANNIMVLLKLGIIAFFLCIGAF